MQSSLTGFPPPSGRPSFIGVPTWEDRQAQETRETQSLSLWWTLPRTPPSPLQSPRSLTHPLLLLLQQCRPLSKVGCSPHSRLLQHQLLDCRLPSPLQGLSLSENRPSKGCLGISGQINCPDSVGMPHQLKLDPVRQTVPTSVPSPRLPSPLLRNPCGVSKSPAMPISGSSV